MRSPLGRLVAVAALGGSAMASVAAAGSGLEHPAGGLETVQLLAPAPAAPLPAGSEAVLEWAPRPGFEGLPAREEWEAFLSLDGGRSYPIRITPHLDIDLHRAVWEVPAVTSPDVRILMRVGDERHEVAIELPERFSIAQSGTLSPFALPPAFSAHAGEAARPGDPGVRIWSEGSRSGGGRHLRAANPGGPYDLEDGRQEPPPALAPERAALAATAAPRLALTAPPAATAAPGARTTETAPAPADPPRQPPVDLLLQAMRRNE
jgi:hypothetical protein